MAAPKRSDRLLRVLAGVAVAVGLTACSSSPTTASTTSRATATTTLRRATTTTVALTPAGGTYGVGRTDLTLVDSSRGTDADEANDVGAKDDRTLKTVVLYPTSNRADDASTNEHPVAQGVFPLLVFSHGVTASGPMYAGILKQVAAAGYVVALPTFPLTSGPKGWGNLGQVVNQPGDVAFIISELLKRSAADDDPLSGHLSAQAVGISGHSLGAITSLLFYNSCCVDTRVRAVVAVSGTLFPAPDKSDNYDDPPNIPLLVLHGKDDGTVPYTGSKNIFDTFTTVPRAFVTFPGTGHTDILGKPSFLDATIAFLDLTLRGDPTAWKRLDSTLADNGDATVQVAGGLTATH